MIADWQVNRNILKHEQIGTNTYNLILQNAKFYLLHFGEMLRNILNGQNVAPEKLD